MLVGEREGGKPCKGDDVTELIGKPESVIFSYIFEKIKRTRLRTMVRNSDLKV